MSPCDRILRLMECQAEEHDMEWLKGALQAALELEFFTIPPYLAARWSIIDESDPVVASIKEVGREEMTHMAAVCNLIVALGERPLMMTAEALPSYPGPLPGGVKPGLEISLGALTPKSVKSFADLEAPSWYEEACHVEHEHGDLCSIGAFYEAIEEAFLVLKPDLKKEGQIQDPNFPIVVENLEDVSRVLEHVRDQGEGSETDPNDSGPGDLAHFFRFMEVVKGVSYVQDATGKWDYKGDPVPFPACYPMAVVPKGGYARDEVSAEVAHLLREFDQLYTDMLIHLQKAWDEGDQMALWKGVNFMMKMKRPARTLMQIPIPGGEGNYGPCFRLLS